MDKHDGRFWGTMGASKNSCSTCRRLTRNLRHVQSSMHRCASFFGWSACLNLNSAETRLLVGLGEYFQEGLTEEGRLIQHGEYLPAVHL